MSTASGDGRHYCDQPSCDKSFQRAEHLKRHKLNHTNKIILCPHCAKSFYRNDLLQRHLSLKHSARPSAHGRTTSSAMLQPRDEQSAASAGGRPGHSNATMATGYMPESNMISTFSPNGSAHSLGGAYAQQPLMDPQMQTGSGFGESALPFSPFRLENYGHNFDWLDNISPNFGGDQGMHDVHLGSASSRPSQSPHDMIFDASIVSQVLSIDQQTFADLLGFLAAASDTFRLTHNEMIDLLETAFLHIDTFLPIFHRPTLDLNSIPRELCATFMCMGLFLSNRPGAYDAACRLLARLRGMILSIAQEKIIKAEQLWVLQAMLLTEVEGMYYADRAAMEQSDIFHGTLVTLARRLGLFDSDQERTRPMSGRAVEQKWLQWIQQESSKRLAYFIFVIDVQHALFFGHNRSITSVFSVRQEFPCDAEQWQAPGLHAWAATKESSRRRLKYDEVFQLLLATHEGYERLPTLDAISAYLVVSGLASTARDYLQRKHESFFDRKAAINHLSSLLRAVHQRLGPLPDTPFKSHCLVTYYISKISLRTPLDDLERAANSGFSLTGGTPIEHARSATIRLFTRYKVDTDTAIDAVHLIGLYLRTAEGRPSPFESSGLYIGALTLWAFILGQGYESDGYSVSSEDRQADLHALEQAIRTNAMKNCVALWKTVAQVISARLAEKENDNAKEYSEVLRTLRETIT